MNRELGCTFDNEVDLPKGWKRVTGVSNALVTAMLGSYWRHINDALGVMGFINALSGSELFISSDGWVLINNARPGFSAAVHAAKWGLHSDEDASSYEELLDWVASRGKFGVLNAAFADHAEMAIKLAKEIGFEEMGLIPAFDTYLGEIHNVKLFTRISH